MFKTSKQFDFSIENIRLLEYGFNTSEILDLRCFTNIRERLKNVKKTNDVLTIGGSTVQQLRDHINNCQFVSKVDPTCHLDTSVMRSLGFTNQEISDIERYITRLTRRESLNIEKYSRLPDLRIVIGSIETNFCRPDDQGIFGFRLDEIRDALTEYRQREAYFKAQGEKRLPRLPQME